MDEYACSFFSIVAQDMRMDAEEKMFDLGLAQSSGQVSRGQKDNAGQMRNALKAQASDILEPTGQNGGVQDLKKFL